MVTAAYGLTDFVLTFFSIFFSDESMNMLLLELDTSQKNGSEPDSNILPIS